jgi:hypothetical protein
MPTKQQTVATEQESVQAEKEDTTQLYIGLNIIVKGFVRLGWVGSFMGGCSHLLIAQSVWSRVRLS